MTLLETVVSLALLGLTTTAFASALSVGLFLTVRVDDMTVAGTVARYQIEDTLSRPYAELPNYPTITPPTGFNVSLATQGT